MCDFREMSSLSTNLYVQIDNGLCAAYAWIMINMPHMLQNLMRVEFNVDIMLWGC